MAKIQHDVIVLKLSKLVKDSESDDYLIADFEMLKSLEQVVQELVEAGVLVEVERVDK